MSIVAATASLLAALVGEIHFLPLEAGTATAAVGKPCFFFNSRARAAPIFKLFSFFPLKPTNNAKNKTKQNQGPRLGQPGLLGQFDLHGRDRARHQLRRDLHLGVDDARLVRAEPADLAAQAAGHHHGRPRLRLRDDAGACLFVFVCLFICLLRLFVCPH